MNRNTLEALRDYFFLESWDFKKTSDEHAAIQRVLEALDIELEVDEEQPF